MLDWQTVLMLQKTIAFAAIGPLAIAAYSDFRTYRIPNAVVLTIAGLGSLRLILLALTGDLISTFFAAAMVAVVFLVGLVLFSRRLIGGGDVKLIMATIPLIRYRDWYEFFVLMAGFGALASILIIVLRNYLPLAFGPRLAAHMQAIRLSVPYGVAIAGAGIVTLLLQPILFRYSFPFAPTFLW